MSSYPPFAPVAHFGLVLVAPNYMNVKKGIAVKGSKSANPFFPAWKKKELFLLQRQSCDRLTAVTKFTAFKQSPDDLYSLSAETAVRKRLKNGCPSL